MEHTLLQWAHQLGTLEYWQTLLDRFGDLGPLAPITLAVVESFFPPLPLIAIVALNVGAHGGILGFLYSWIGVALGGTLMFLLLPFAPSSFMHLAFGISDFDEKRYLITMLLGKGVMVAMMAVFGQSLVSSMKNPLYLVLAVGLWAAMYAVSKRFCKRHHLD